jgi:hypothetical protein
MGIGKCSEGGAHASGQEPTIFSQHLPFDVRGPLARSSVNEEEIAFRKVSPHTSLFPDIYRNFKEVREAAVAVAERRVSGKAAGNYP